MARRGDARIRRTGRALRAGVDLRAVDRRSARPRARASPAAGAGRRAAVADARLRWLGDSVVSLPAELGLLLAVAFALSVSRVGALWTAQRRAARQDRPSDGARRLQRSRSVDDLAARVARSEPPRGMRAFAGARHPQRLPDRSRDRRRNVEPAQSALYRFVDRFDV